MIAFDWNQILDQIVNSILPDVAKIVFYSVIVPLIAAVAQTIHRKIVESHFGFVIKYVAQKIPTSVEGWQEKRLASAIEESKKYWYLKWMNEDDMKKYIEVAVRTYRDALLAQNVAPENIH